MYSVTMGAAKDMQRFHALYQADYARISGYALRDLAAQHPGATLNTSLEDYQKAIGIEAPGPIGDPSVKKS